MLCHGGKIYGCRVGRGTGRGDDVNPSSGVGEREFLIVCGNSGEVYKTAPAMTAAFIKFEIPCFAIFHP